MPDPIATLQLHAFARTLAFLAFVAVVGAAGLTAGGLLLAGRHRLARRVAAGAGTVALAYLAVVVAVGAVARGDRVLPLGASKYVCELDCHLAYAVTAVRAAPGAGSAGGASHLVTVRTWFDGATTSAGRGDAPLRPNERRVRIVDARGRAYPPVGLTGAPLDAPLRPGASYETTLAFRLPPDASRPRLEVAESLPVTWLLVGHENSPLHGRTLLALDAAPR